MGPVSMRWNLKPIHPVFSIRRHARAGTRQRVFAMLAPRTLRRYVARSATTGCKGAIERQGRARRRPALSLLVLTVIGAVEGQPRYVLISFGVPGIVASMVSLAVILRLPHEYATGELRRMAARKLREAIYLDLGRKIASIGRSNSRAIAKANERLGS
jgi:hypothetical protein